MTALPLHRVDSHAGPLTDQLSLKEALAALRQAVDAGVDTDIAFRDCALADSRVRQAHAHYRDIGQLAVQCQRWELAEAFAIRALVARPRFGAAFKLLGSALRGAGRPEDAAICHRYGLPGSVLDKHFSRVGLHRVRSDPSSRSGARKWHAFPTTRHVLKQPRQLRPRPIVELKAAEVKAAEGFTVAVPKGRLWFDTFNTIVWNADGDIIDDATRGFAEIVAEKAKGGTPKPLDGLVCLLGNRNALNYYHWMNDVLPRLEVLRTSGFEVSSISRFVVPPLQHEFHWQTLAHFGIEEDRLHFTSNGEYLTADELLIPMFGSNSLGLAQGPWNPAFLKREFGRASPQGVMRRLYISRGTTGARGISNEPDLVKILEEFGFEQLQSEQLSVAQQADLFASASVVIGPHGAGFTNIAFCQPGTTVIELFNAHMAPCFWTISELTGLHHAVHFCGDFDESTRPSVNERYHRSADDRRRSTFSVNVDEVVELLELLGIHR